MPIVGILARVLIDWTLDMKITIAQMDREALSSEKPKTRKPQRIGWDEFQQKH